MRVSRPIPVPIDSAPFQLPLIATPIATGFAQPTTDYVEAGIDFNRLVYEHPAATYVLKVADDALSESGLWAGDLVVVDASLTPQPGDPVVAQVGDDFLLACFERQQGVILLTPENPAFPPVVVTPGMEETSLFGVVTYVLNRNRRRRR